MLYYREKQRKAYYEIMRDALSQVKGHKTFQAVVDRISITKGYKNRPTILLVDIKDRHGKLIADHVWMKYDEAFARIRVGHVVEFKARIRSYTKRLKGKTVDGVRVNKKVQDYTFTQPKQIKVIGFCLDVFE